MGAAVATLNPVDIVINGLNKQSDISIKSCPVTVFGFASPKVGYSGCKKVFDSMKDVFCLRINNAPDVVPKYPIVGYSDVGSELVINTLKSPYVKLPGHPRIWNNMQAYMHGVAGVQTDSFGWFKLAINRDLALVNKFGVILDNKYGVPSFWFVAENSGMVKKQDGMEVE